ncbi:MAG: hypothetical protein EAZ53_05705 [Bacteroidetes bacterium]|nr:MAG: hypothetical protein EAZ53_05705 [Bacteroidota bacterium]
MLFSKSEKVSLHHFQAHLIFFSTHKTILKNPKKSFFCIRSATVPTEKRILANRNRKNIL